MKASRLKQMLVKEFIQILRDPRMRGVVFLFPCIEVLLIGYAVSTDVRHTPTAVYDLDASSESREFVDRMTASGYFDLVAKVGSPRELAGMIDTGEAKAAVQFNRGFAADLRAGRTAELQAIFDGSDSNTAAVALGYLNRIAAEFSDKVMIARFNRMGGQIRDPALLELRTRAWFNENLESRNFYVPGVIVIIVSMVTLLLTAMAVVREKEIGTMEQILATPITPAEFILGKTIPFVIIAMIDVVFVTAIGQYWFDVPFRGSLWLLAASVLVYVMTTLGCGLLISTIARTQQQAMMTVFFFFFPAMLLSGFSFPIANMPLVVQWLTLLNPLRYFLIIIRGIFLKGVGLSILWPEILVLAVMGVSVMTYVARRFHKTI